MSDLPLRNVLLGLALGVGLVGYGWTAMREDGAAMGGIAAVLLGLPILTATALSIRAWLRLRNQTRGRHERPWGR